MIPQTFIGAHNGCLLFTTEAGWAHRVVNAYPISENW